MAAAAVPNADTAQSGAKVFALGLGVQKGGTSWLHHTIAKSPQADMGFTKEYHIWDGLTLPDFAIWRPTLRNHFANLTANPAYLLDRLRKLPGMRMRAALARSPDAYFDYFAGLLQHDGITLTGDLTPAYSALSESTLHQIRAGFDERGIAIRAILTMRDPVERAWSALRMNKRAFHERNLLRHERGSDEEEIMLFVDQPSYRARGDYAATLARMNAVFAERERFACLYENLFAPETVARICAFLGIPEVPSDADHRVNVTRKTDMLSEDMQARIAGIFRDSYLACADRFGKEAIRTAWPSARFILED